MRFAYLILAHRGFEQIESLVGRLLRDDPDDIVVLHVDALNGEEYDYAHLISGQDWPLLTKAEIEAAIEPGRCYLTLDDNPMLWRMNGFYFHNHLVSPHEHHSIPSRLWRRMLGAAGAIAGWSARLAGRRRRCTLGPEWKKGETWWSLPRTAIDHLRPLLAGTIASGRLRYSLNSDEHAVQTILAYSPFAATMESNRRYLRWRGTPSPELLERDHLPAIRASQSWFARKCDIAHDPFFLEL